LDEKIDVNAAVGLIESYSGILVDIREKTLPGMEALIGGKLTTSKSVDALVNLALIIL